MATGEEGGVAAGQAQRRLILCFDGTWNGHENQTNVARLYDAIADYKCGCDHQQKYYDEGVGTTPKSKFRGGIFGTGMEENILEGYCWLIRELGRKDWAPQAERADADGQTFHVGPDIFLFGFSRGAYTARSLGGMINRCGVLRLDLLDLRDDKGEKIESPTLKQIRKAPRVQEAWDLYRKTFPHGDEVRLLQPVKDFRKAHSWTVTIKFIGVWDTVGARGLPMTRSGLTAIWNNRKYAFHDTALGRTVENAYHAMAIDEHREDYDIALWTAKHKKAQDGTIEQKVEQRWFPGAHSNVGGGYEDDLLADAPLEWMSQRAIECGMQFIRNPAETDRHAKNCATVLPADFALTGDEHRWPVRDSFAEFGYGLYAAYKRAVNGVFVASGRHFRQVLVHGIEERVDVTATLKMSSDPNYRPRNLALAGLEPG